MWAGSPVLYDQLGTHVLFILLLYCSLDLVSVWKPTLSGFLLVERESSMKAQASIIPVEKAAGKNSLAHAPRLRERVDLMHADSLCHT